MLVVLSSAAESFRQLLSDVGRLHTRGVTKYSNSPVKVIDGHYSLVQLSPLFPHHPTISQRIFQVVNAYLIELGNLGAF